MNTSIRRARAAGLALALLSLGACGSTSSAGDAAILDGGGGVPCGTTTCATGRICVHTTAGGGACQPVPDGGVCPPGTRGTTCCSAFSESYACADRPSGCDTLACGCATALCAAGTPSCPCMSASGAQLECGCQYP